jgi:rhamnulokinase
MTGAGSGAGFAGAISLAAVDLGASSGRVIHGRVGPGVLQMQEVRRFRNGAVALPDGLYWDILGLYQDIIAGLRDACRENPDISGVAIDSWAVDYGLLDGNGSLLGNPRHYRDERTAGVIDTVHAAVPAEKLYGITGLQYLPFNTLYQFAADPRIGEPGVHALLIPDLLGYWMTGERITEDTNASTTGLLDARTGQWSAELIDTLALSPSLLPRVVPPGSVIGDVTAAVRAQLGLDRPLTVTTVGSHDTASAIVGVPAENPHFAYISCGTWGLVGVELDAPVLTEESRAANFTNERGVDGTIRYLRNVMGLWLLSESLRSWELQGHQLSLTELLASAADVPAGGPIFDPDAPEFLPPGDMPKRIVQACLASGRRPPQTRPEIVRCILDSLAVTFAARVHDAGRLSGQPIEVIHIVGGGSQNRLLCQLVANAAGLPVIAGPVEATALGNLLVQARTHRALTGDLWELRAQLRAAVTTAVYQPRPVPAGKS